MKSLFRFLALALPLLCSVAMAAPPSTLGYQGRLATNAGIPITADLSITFRLYDVPSGGSALWSETQPSVQVDAGSLSVELGKITPLPALAWGKQLYLGIQVSGDTEMAPRPPLTATPFALRSAGTKKNSLEVSAEGTAVQNGTALLAAVAGVAGLSASNPLTIELDAGTYDLGTSMLSLPSFVTLIGQGQDASIITSANAQGTVKLASDTHIRNFTARNTGTPPTSNDAAFGIAAATDPASNSATPADNVTLENVTGESTGAAAQGAGARQGIYVCASNSRIVGVTGKGIGGDFSLGMRADCTQQRSLFIDGLTVFSSGGYTGVRGLYIAGGGPWSNIKVFVDANTGAAAALAPTVYGIRVFSNTVNVGAGIMHLFINVSGNLATAAPPTLVEGIKVEVGADVWFKDVGVNMEDIKGQFISGVRAWGNETSGNVLKMIDTSITVAGIQDAAAGPGNIWGLRLQGASPEFTRANIKVKCLAGGANGCVGIERSVQTTGSTLQPGTLVLDQVTAEVGHIDPAASGAPSSTAYRDIAAARVVNSTLRVTRSPADNEPMTGINANAPGADIRVSNSTVETVDATGANPGCVTSGSSGAMELYMNHFAGPGCTGGTTMTCAGNTKRGSGLLASTCP